MLLFNDLIRQDVGNLVFFQNYKGINFIINLLKNEGSDYIGSILELLCTILQLQSGDFLFSFLWYIDSDDMVREYISNDFVRTVIRISNKHLQEVATLSLSLTFLAYCISCIDQLDCIQDIILLLTKCVDLPNHDSILVPIIQVYRFLSGCQNDDVNSFCNFSYSLVIIRVYPSLSLRAWKLLPR